MRKSTKKRLPKSGRKDEIRRADNLSPKINKKLHKPFSKLSKVETALTVIGTVITVGMSIYGLIPKVDKIPHTDTQRNDLM